MVLSAIGKKLAIDFRPITEEEDISRLYHWRLKPHVIPFWGNPGPQSRFRDEVQKALAVPKQKLLFGRINGVDMSYWETYSVCHDLIGHYYEYDEYDRGVHLLIGRTDFLGRGYALPLLMERVAREFHENHHTRRIVAEPDVRNEKMIHIFKKCGFRPLKLVSLPEKTGMLLAVERRHFFERWREDAATKRV